MANEAPDRDELRLLYEVTVSDLTYFKTQQWSVANYCMLSYAALVGVATLLRADLRLGERIALVTLALATCISTLIVLSKLQTSISIRQTRLDALRESLGTAYVRAWSSEYKPRERIHAVHMLQAAVPTAFVLVGWLIGVRL